ncbi:hypothetical protein BUE80_DR002580 [Diplocarpon rosae]|nr:hypothetical protein BUE80_DR002580 [Diplocarpon rosae]
MSSEVVKKRGRPKKVNPDAVAGPLSESMKPATTRAKSTKATTKTKAAPATFARTPAPKKPAAKPTVNSAPVRSASRMPSTSMKIPWEKQILPGNVAVPTSKVLEQVKDQATNKELRKETTVDTLAKPSIDPSKPPPAKLRAKEASRPAQSNTASCPTPTSTSANRPKSTGSSPPLTTKPTPPLPTTAPKSTPTSTPKPHVPIAELNSAIVSDISARAGARRNTASSQQLPKNYKPVARKVTATIVALPIALVTGYVLYQRLVLGQEKKMLSSQRNVATEMKVEVTKGN